MYRLRVNIVMFVCKFLIHHDKFHWLYSYISRTTTYSNNKPADAKKMTIQDVERLYSFIDQYVATQERYRSCLLRSVGGYILLRKHGATPRFFIGVCVQPFKAHAWVEVDNCPVCEHYEDVTTFEKML